MREWGVLPKCQENTWTDLLSITTTWVSLHWCIFRACQHQYLNTYSSYFNSHTVTCLVFSLQGKKKKKSLKLCLYLVLCVTYLFHWKQNMGKNVNKNTKQKKTVSEPLDEQKMDKMPSAITFMYHSSGLEMEVRLVRRLDGALQLSYILYF